MKLFRVYGRKNNTRVLQSNLSLQNKQESGCSEGSTLKQSGPSSDYKIWRYAKLAIYCWFILFVFKHRCFLLSFFFFPAFFFFPSRVPYSFKTLCYFSAKGSLSSTLPLSLEVHIALIALISEEPFQDQ